MNRVNKGSAPCSGDILYNLWTAWWLGRGSIGGGDWVGVPLDGTDNDLFRDDGFWLFLVFFWSMETRQGISFYILGTWDVGNCKIEPG